MDPKEIQKQLDALIAKSRSYGRQILVPRSVRLDARDLPKGMHLDANETMVLQRQLNQVLSRVYETKYGLTKARLFVPQTSEVMAGMRTYSWREFTNVGEAKLITNGADDLPSVNSYAREDAAHIRPFGDSFEYDLFQLQRAARFGEPLSARLAIAARQAYERKVDNVLSTGMKEAGLMGFVNNPNVDVIQAPDTGTGSSRLWADKTGALIVADLEYMVTNRITATKENEIPNRILLSTARHRYIETTPYSDYTSDSILTVFLRNSKHVNQVDSWAKLDTADAAGTGPRAVCYRYDEMALSYEEPVPFTTLPPQARNLAFVINCYGAYGGVVLYLPKSVVYMDAS